MYNKRFLDKAIERGDDFVLATKPTPDVLYNTKGELTGLGKEIEYLESKNYEYISATNEMVKR